MKKFSFSSLSVTALSVAVLMSSLVALSQDTAAPVVKNAEQMKNESLGVYPVPQQVKRQKATFTTKGLNYEGAKADADALNLLKKHFPSSAQGVELLIGEKSNPALAEYARNLPDRPEAYVLTVTPDKVVIVGHEGNGTYYGVQTLLQMIKKGDKGWQIPCVEIVDWPDIRFRGTVEGFYGKPWRFEDRLSQFEFYGKNKLNTYIYGPKDDPYHGFSTRWREFYPAEQAKHISELVSAAKRNKVNFVWAVHPGRDIKWGDADRQAALKKYQAMYDLGVRSFGVFFDDIGGEGAKPEGQTEFLNFLNREFIHKKPDVTPLIMCPTEYWGGGGAYHDYMSKNLDPDINVMWTGDRIVCDITKKDLDRINSHIKRPVFVWWNFPVTDYVRHALFLGRTYGVEPGTKGDMSGFVSNPMDKPEASKITLFGIADMTWNQNGYNSDKAWHEGIKRLFPDCAEAVQIFADHNSDGGPSGHNYRREESVRIAPAVNGLLSKLRAGGAVSKTEEAKAVKAEFEKIEQSPAIIRKKANNPAFLMEVRPWLASFEYLGKSGKAVLSMQEGVEAGEWNKAIGNALNASVALSGMKEEARKEAAAINKITGDHWQTDIRTGTLVMRPAVEEILDTGAGAILTKLANRSIMQQRPYVSSSLKNDVEKMLDEDPNSSYYCQELQKVGDYFGVDLGSVQDVRTVNIVMGRQEGDHDAVHQGQLEISKDGKTWENLMPESKGTRVHYEGSGKKGRFVRYRSTHAGIPGGKSDVWTAVRDFRVNKPEITSVATDNDSFKTVKLEINDKMLSLKPLLEVHAMKPGQTVGIDIPSGEDVAVIGVNFKTKDMDWAKLEITRDGKTWQMVPLTKQGEGYQAKVDARIKGARVRNDSRAAQDVTLSEFKLNRPAGSTNTGIAMDGKLSTYLAIAPGSERVEIPNNYEKAGSVVILSDGTPADVYICGADDKWQKVGALDKGRITTLSLKSAKKPVKALGITGNAKTPAHVFEVVWR